MRWLFLEDGSAVQTIHVHRLSWYNDVTRDEYVVRAHLPGPAQPFVVARYITKSEAQEAIKDMVVGREYKRNRD